VTQDALAPRRRALEEPAEEPVEEPSRIGPAPSGRAWHNALLVLVLGQMLVLMLLSSAGDTLTYDEPAHIAAAAAYVGEGDVTWNWEHPPLTKVLAGISMRLGGLDPPRDTPEHEAHDDFGWGRQVVDSDPSRVRFLARLPLMLLTVAFGLVVHAFASDLWGRRGGLLATAVYAVTPDVVAHGKLVTTDVAVSGFLLTTSWALWRARRGGSPGYLVVSGLAMGLALATKFTALVFVPVFLALFALVTWRLLAERLADARQVLTQALAATVLAGAGALVVLWAVYLVIDPTQSSERPVPPAAFHATGPFAALADLMPVPSAYRTGLRFAIGAEEGRLAFLFGELYRGGRASFYPLGLLVKTPLGALALWAAGAAVAARRRRRDVALFVVAPAAVWLAMAMTSQLNIGVRHVMPVVVFSSVLAGGAVAAGVGRTAQRLALAALVAAAASSWIAHPNQLSYSNELFGGVAGTHRYLSDSSVDWGQDLDRLGRWLRDHADGERVYLSYFGQADPRQHGIRAEPVPPAEDLARLDEGILAISASTFSVYGDPASFAGLGDPDHVVGGSILVWRLPLVP